MPTYHQRRPEKTITGDQEMLEIIAGQSIMTLAMSMDNEPYLVTVNYGFDPAQRSFYFHCGQAGKKIDYMRANPIVWGQVLDDRGYLDGACDHAFRTIHFRGRASFLESDADKRQALGVMIDHLEKDPEPVKKRFIGSESLEKVALVRVQVLEMTGKRNPK
jgi:hypothetical protein